MNIARTEVFGPVLSVSKTGSEAEAIDIANSTEYGLVGGIFTADIDAAHRAARRIRAGQIFITEWYAGGVETPFGGYGKSGYGCQCDVKRLELRSDEEYRPPHALISWHSPARSHRRGHAAIPAIIQGSE